ncbi:tetratricopeptide repeat protein [Novosphingobium resinovorum]|uniref:tetratricopeptide repeat protein n=1 Tax=Novosphingobium resinovorum TaxID=158500 RepID=UPI002ED16FD1|nr:tetratricopeptide repeat protein [Novosphingobium resinovorum]
MALPPDTSSAAARNAAQQDVFLREVDDAVRQDQLEGFMSRYGKPLIAVIVIALLAFAGWIYWDHRQTKAREERSEAYVQALDALQSENLDAAKGKLAPVAAAGSSDATVVSARLMLAGIALRQNRKADALKLYGEIAADGKAPQALRDLASVRAVAADFDAMKPEDVVSRLKPMAAPGNPWFGVAGELVGMAYLKQGKDDQAGPLFAAIAKDEGVEDGLRSRARQLAAVLGVDAVDDVVDDKGEPLGKAKAAPASAQ